MIFGRSQAHKIKKVFLIIQGHVNAKLLEYCIESLVPNQIIPPVLKLSLTLVSQSIQNLWLDVMSLEQLENAR